MLVFLLDCPILLVTCGYMLCNAPVFELLLHSVFATCVVHKSDVSLSLQWRVEYYV